ncbi:hypothetical protein HPCPY6311_0942 [Helicobacter pylori CPY6311]|nr:hypothetical protein HPCPY6311_0942 [Helicobacter pylori CPY6311]
MPKSVSKTPKNLRLIPPIKIPFFFFVKSAPMIVTLFLYKGSLRGFLRLV